MRWLGLAVFLSAAPVAAASVEADEARASERLSSRALEALEGILGPGRAKVLVEVRGERGEVRTATEIVVPIPQQKEPAVRSAVARVLDLPGYTKEGAKIEDGGSEGGPGPGERSEPLFTQRDQENSLRQSGFEIKRIEATVVLDAALPDAQVREVSQLLPQLLRIDGSRGDTLSILRAPMRTAWMDAFARPESLRAASYAGLAFLAALLCALIGGASAVRAARAFASEFARRRASDAAGEGPQRAEPLPELVPGAPGLLDAAGGPAPLEAQAQLGRRFDFLAEREPAAAARALEGESAEDLALLFGHLAESMPDVASRLFGHLRSDVQAEVSQRLLGLRQADPDRLGEVEDRVRRAVEHGLEGSQRLGRILSRVTGDTRADILGRIAARDARGAEEIERHLMPFEGLDALEGADLRRLIVAVPYEVWGAALRGVPETMVRRVLEELPEGPRELVREASAAPQPRDKVLEARSKVLDALASLAAEGAVKAGRAPAEGELL